MKLVWCKSLNWISFTVCYTGRSRVSWWALPTVSSFLCTLSSTNAPEALDWRSHFHFIFLNTLKLIKKENNNNYLLSKIILHLAFLRIALSLLQPVFLIAAFPTVRYTAEEAGSADESFRPYRSFRLHSTAHQLTADFRLPFRCTFYIPRYSEIKQKKNNDNLLPNKIFLQPASLRIPLLY